LDGRKMSKSYDNTIPLFAPKDQLRKLIMGILTDSRAPGEPKSTEGSAVFQLYQAFASAEETADLTRAYADGIAWGEAKQLVADRLEREIAPLREVYDALIQNPAEIEQTLLQGAEKARAIATPFTRRLRHAVGLRPLQSVPVAGGKSKSSKVAAPSFKQYRADDGLFCFKLLDANGQLLLESLGFASPKEAAQVIAQLQQTGLPALESNLSQLKLHSPMSDVQRALAHFNPLAA
ncbi:MAG TPA: tryptophan--tRNA ligase, partial [Hydrogenophaga sp.]|nr:tryptophan--tRNA ligase [Hydrogenophaga sp.]